MVLTTGYENQPCSGYKDSASCGVPVCALAFNSLLCANMLVYNYTLSRRSNPFHAIILSVEYPQTDGQAELSL